MELHFLLQSPYGHLHPILTRPFYKPNKPLRRGEYHFLAISVSVGIAFVYYIIEDK